MGSDAGGGRRARRPGVVVAGLVALAVLVPAACGGPDEITKSEIAHWLRMAGDGNDPEPVIECLSGYMSHRFTQDELRQWLSLDPEEATVERVQRLPRAIEVADHCRGVGGYG